MSLGPDMSVKDIMIQRIRTHSKWTTAARPRLKEGEYALRESSSGGGNFSMVYKAYGEHTQSLQFRVNDLGNIETVHHGTDNVRRTFPDFDSFIHYCERRVVSSAEAIDKKGRKAKDEKIRIAKEAEMEFSINPTMTKDEVLMNIQIAITEGDTKTLAGYLAFLNNKGWKKELAANDNAILIHAVENSPSAKAVTIVKKLLENTAVKIAEAEEASPSYKAARIAAIAAKRKKLAEFITTEISDLELARRSEGAMQALNSQQLKLMQILRRRYGHIIADPKAQRAIIENLKKEIAKRYLENPAKFKPLAGPEKPLPLAYSSKLSEAEKQIYYQHPLHNAYRYFLIPNPWMSSDAGHVAGDPRKGEGYSLIQEEDYEFFALLWEAVNDPELEVPNLAKDATPEQKAAAQKDFIDTYIREFFELNRAHNRDLGKDDKQGDKPTCQWGVTKRMVEFLELRLNIPIISVEQIKNRFESQIIDSMIEKLNLSDLNQLGDIVNKMVITMQPITEADIAFLNEKFTVEPKELVAFTLRCNQIFADEDDPNPMTMKRSSPIVWDGVGGKMKFDTYQNLANFLAGNSPHGSPLKTSQIFTQRLYERILAKKEQIEKGRKPHL